MNESYGWKAPAYHHHEKAPEWFVWSVVIAVVLGIIALVQGNVLFVIFILVAELIVLYRGRRKPVMFEYVIVHDGIEEKQGEGALNKNFIAFNDYVGFALYHDPLTPRYSEVFLKPKGKGRQYRKFLVPQGGLEPMREFLLPRLQELHYEEPLIEHLVKRLKL